LAVEVDNFIKENCDKVGSAKLGRLSFVSHSLGGLIVRAALCADLLQPYLPHCFLFLSLATPHCGYLGHGTNSVLNTGIWLLKKWSKSKCLSQLSLSDHLNPEKAFLFLLSKRKGLEYFEYVFLMASLQDKYAPFHSARIELHPYIHQDKEKGPLFKRMAMNLLAPLEQVVVKRFDITFQPRKYNIDSWIGRTAHICFLDQPLYMFMIIFLYQEYFR